jgi:hypothetical protein
LGHDIKEIKEISSICLIWRAVENYNYIVLHQLTRLGERYSMWGRGEKDIGD